MLDFSWSHILLFLIIALVVVGPKDLPRLMRMIGQWMGKARAMADQFRSAFDDMARQTELDELRQEIANLRNERPLGSVERELNQSIIPDDMKSKVPPPGGVQVEPEPAHIPDPPLPEPPPRSGEFNDAPEPRDGELAVTDAPIAAAGYEPPPP
jgi:sec-independent protein translocase protein TatB